jgi:hypothetical protein
VPPGRAEGEGGSAAPREGPPGRRSELEHVATAFNAEPWDCGDLSGDGHLDLSMEPSSQELVAVLELHELPGGNELKLVVTGNLLDGTPFEARDCVVIRQWHHRR